MRHPGWDTGATIPRALHQFLFYVLFRAGNCSQSYWPQRWRHFVRHWTETCYLHGLKKKQHRIKSHNFKRKKKNLWHSSLFHCLVSSWLKSKEFIVIVNSPVWLGSFTPHQKCCLQGIPLLGLGKSSQAWVPPAYALLGSLPESITNELKIMMQDLSWLFSFNSWQNLNVVTNISVGSRNASYANCFPLP